MMRVTNEPSLVPPKETPWYRGLAPYHWWVLAIGALAWLFDCMDQRLFVLSRSPALSQLVGAPQTDPLVKTYGNYATAAMMVGWAAGGLFFGIVGDKWGRARTLSTSILVYSLFTGLCGLSQHWWDFCVYRFLTGCGVGGAFATAATLIAETMPNHARAFALGMFQALSAAGNITGSAVGRWVIPPESHKLAGWFEGGIPGWRLLFFVGLLPSLLVVFIMRTVREPEQWHEARRTASQNLQKQMGDWASLFSDPRWRRSTLVGVGLAVAGVVGLWGAGFWSPELINEALTPAEYRGPNAPPIPPEVALHISNVKTTGTLIQDVGAFFGMFAFTVLATRLGRRISFATSFLAAFVVVSAVFLTLRHEWQVWFMTPLVGFVTLSVFGGYSIYFPEIFPTRLRSTGTAFCYNVARVLSAVIMLLELPIRRAMTQAGVAEVFRWGAVAMCSFYLLGVIVLIWAHETKGKPLPED